MAVMHDNIRTFDLYQPTSVDDAVKLLGRLGSDAWTLAGGLDSMDWFKDRTKPPPKAVVDLGAIDELRGIRSTADGLEIGAMTTLTEIANNPDIQANYKILAEAAGLVATPQIRNQGTLGGNLCQDTRCWYYRGGWPCYRAGGNICYADTPTSMNREHAIFGASRCVAVNPSDTAPAVVALDAQMVVRRGASERVIEAEDFFIGPAVDIERMTVLRAGDLLVAIRIPSTWAGARFYFEKVRDRNAWDFPLANIASAMRVEGGRIQDVRIVVNAVAPYPMRLKSTEAELIGQPPEESVGATVGELAIYGARPLAMNGYKVSLMRNLVMRAVRGTVA